MLKVIHKSLAFTMSLLIMLTTLSVYPITASAAETASHTWVDATITNSPYWETSFNGKVTQYQYIVKHLINGEPAFCLDVSVSSNSKSPIILRNVVAVKLLKALTGLCTP